MYTIMYVIYATYGVDARWMYSAEYFSWLEINASPASESYFGPSGWQKPVPVRTVGGRAIDTQTVFEDGKGAAESHIPSFCPPPCVPAW